MCFEYKKSEPLISNQEMTDPLATSVMLIFAGPLVATGDITQYNFGKINARNYLFFNAP